MGITLGFSRELSVLLGIAADMAIVPIFLFLINPLFNNFRKVRGLRDLINRYETRSADKIKHYKKHRVMGLFLLVTIPKPAVTGYAGCAAASGLNASYRNTLLVMCAGVLVTGLLNYLISSGVLDRIAG